MSSNVWAVARNICALNDVKMPTCTGQHAPAWETISTASGFDGCLPCVAATCVSRSRVPEFVPSDDDVNDDDHDSDDHDSDDSDDATIGVAFTLVDSVLICKRLNHHERFAAALLKAVLEVFEQHFLAHADDVAVAHKIAAVGAGLMARTLLKGASLVSLGSNDPDVARAVRELTFQSARHLAALENQQAHVLLDAQDFDGAGRCMEEELRCLEVVVRHCDYQCRFAQLVGSGVAASACDGHRERVAFGQASTRFNLGSAAALVDRDGGDARAHWTAVVERAAATSVESPLAQAKQALEAASRRERAPAAAGVPDICAQPEPRGSGALPHHDHVGSSQHGQAPDTSPDSALARLLQQDDDRAAARMLLT